MKAISVVALIVAVALQATNAQVIRTCGNVVTTPVVGGCGCGCGCASTVASPLVTAGPTTVVQVPSVANSLADTLSLLTVSSLLAETLPLGPAIVTGVPMGGCGGWDTWNAPWTGPWGGCGCGGSCGGCGYGYGLGYNVLL